jgi:hypothetical protein
MIGESELIARVIVAPLRNPNFLQLAERQQV